MKRNSNGYIWILVIALVLCLLGGCCVSFNDTEYVVTITDKERVVTDGSSYYLIFAEDANGESLVFENTDNWLRGKFDSSNTQGELREGCTYKITAVGIRVPLFSWYPNIIDVQEVES